MIKILEYVMGVKMSSEATTAAYIQAGGTILAGLLALLAGFLAYRAATEETRRHKLQEKNKRIAFAQHMELVIRGLLNSNIEDFSGTKKEHAPRGIFSRIDRIKTNLDIDWQNLSLLEENIRKEIFNIQTIINGSKVYDENDVYMGINPDEFNMKDINERLEKINEMLGKSIIKD